MADELTVWAQYHATLFGLDTERDAEMLLAWVDVFRDAGYDPAELREASQWLAAHDAPRYRSDHLAAIQAHVRGCRQRHAAPPDTRGTCTLCGGTGRVIVPDPRAESGRWATCAVLCSCPTGLWYADRPPKDHPPQMTLAAYAVAYPDWQAVVRTHAESLRQPTHEAALRRRLQSSLPGMSRLGPITDAVDRVLGRVQTRKKGE